MQKSLLKMLGVVAVCSFSTTAYALGLGGINVSSALGQPLKADIALVSVSKDDKASLVARIASPEAYKGAGLEYPSGNKFKFQLESRANGEPYLLVTSSQPTSDPFVSLLVELSWSSGRLLREYTFLLDPPGYVVEQPAPVEVQAVAPAIPSIPATVKSAEQPSVVKPATEKKIESQVVVPAAQGIDTRTEPRQVASGSITVKRGDTLSKIAAENKSADVSLERMLVALYSANADQFDGNNMNRIKTGKILRLPVESELAAVSQASATKEIRAQAADWNTYRQKLASAASIRTQSETGQQVSTGKISSSVADKTPVAKETAKEVLKLSKGEVPGDKAAAGGAGKVSSTQDQKNAAQEESIAKAKAAKEEQARIALLEKNLKDMQRLAELKSQALAELQISAASSVASAVAAVSEVAAASSVEVTSEVASTSAVAAASAPAPVAKPVPVAPVVEPTLVEQIIAEPLYLAGGAAILGLGGLALFMRRRKNVPAPKAVNAAKDLGSSTGKITAPIAPSPDTGDFTNPGDSLNHAVSAEEDVNPLKEADLFLSFGRDAQAEEILKEALQNTPTNPLIHVKLLGIYANRKDVNSFTGVARQLFDLGNDEANQQAAAMGRKIDPTNPMYASSASIEDADSATMQTTVLQATPDFVLDEEPVATPDLDFDLGASTQSVAPDFAEIASSTMVISPSAGVEDQPEVLPEVLEEQAGLMDFDITATDSSTAVPEVMDFDVTSTSSSPAAPTVMDFDLTVTNPSLTAPTGTADDNAADLGDLVFDVTATHPSMPAVNSVVEQVVAPVAVAEDKLDQEIDFALDFPVAEPAAKAVVAPSVVDFGGIDLNLDGLGADASTAEESLPKDEHWHEVATKLDLAKAYQEMGDSTGAKEILDEVLQEGDEEQRQAAQALLDQLA